MPDAKKWTRFMDMHSGGETKIPPYEYIYIEAAGEEARKIFRQRFGRDPDNVTCECCGEDFSVDEDDSLEQATGYERGCGFVYFDREGNERTITEWLALPWTDPSKCDWTGRYVERPKHSGRAVVPLAEYLKRENVLVIRKEDHA